MRNYVLILLLLTSLLFAVPRVQQVQQLDLQREALLPSFSEDGTNILFSSSDGLYRYERGSKEIFRYAESGYDALMDSKGRIIYRQDSYEKGRRLISIMSFDSKSEKLETLVPGFRPDIAPVITDKAVYSIEKKRIRVDHLNSDRLTKPLALSRDNSLLLYSYGTGKILQPAGDRPHLWPSVSPKADLLCVVGGNDLYVSDFNGNVLFTVKDARAPQWSPDGRWIAYMRDKDDGHVVTGSEIHLVSSDGSLHLQLTESADLFEMYPQWSPDGRQLICDEPQTGKPVLITLEIK